MHIGASDIQTEGQWFNVDGTPVDTTAFGSYNLNNVDWDYPAGDSRRTNADCGALSIDRFIDNNCETARSFICELLF